MTDTIWILKNGTTIAVYTSANGSGFNQTGSEANNLSTGVFAGLYEEVEVDLYQAFYTNNTSLFHSTGTSTSSVGGKELLVTNYAMNSGNEVVNACGRATTYDAFSMSIGFPSGMTFPIVTNLQLTGLTTVGESASPFNINLKITAYTQAQ